MTFQEFQQRYTYNTTSDRLGEGGFGKVFKAYDTYLDRWVAIKIAPVLPNLESVRLKKEVELISKLPAHPNVARYEECYTYSSFDGEYDFGILQYYEEGNLLDLLKKGNLSQEQKYNMLKQILSGLDFLHKNAIIHRDLKPQNILIVKRGNDYIPKITDFGISKKLDVNKSSVFSNSIAGVGTLAYSSPEQLGDRTIRKNTDLWSFGIIAYQVLTGELPFTTGVHGNTSEAGRQELFSQINSGKLPEKINMVEEPWQRLIRRCLVSGGDERVKDCGECREVLSGEDDNTQLDSVKEETDNAIFDIPEQNTFFENGQQTKVYQEFVNDNSESQEKRLESGLKNDSLPSKPNTYLTLSIIAIVFNILVFMRLPSMQFVGFLAIGLISGIIAIFFSYKVNPKYRKMDYDGAKKSSKKIILFLLASFAMAIFKSVIIISLF
jgi:Serine/threonine protein kinase